MQWVGPIAGAVGVGTLMGPERIKGAKGVQRGALVGRRGLETGSVGASGWSREGPRYGP